MVVLKNGDSFINKGRFEMNNKIANIFKVALFLMMLFMTLFGPLAVADTRRTAIWLASNEAVTVPAGTHMMVRMTDTVNSRTHGEGHKFTAELEGDLVVGDTVVAPRGTKIYGQLTKSEQAGRLRGRSKMTITFTHLMINGQLKPIQTSNIQTVAEKGSAGDTVGKTARGAAIGALADGRDGARTGAKIGLGIAVLTTGRSINIPSGTLLDVMLDAPFTP
jgi:hypothetical protein